MALRGGRLCGKTGVGLARQARGGLVQYSFPCFISFTETDDCARLQNGRVGGHGCDGNCAEANDEIRRLGWAQGVRDYV